MLHVTVPLQLFAVKVALSVPQTSVLFADMLGAAGADPCVIVTVFDAGLVPQIVEHVAV